MWIVNADLEEVGVPDFVHIKFVSQHLVGNLPRQDAGIASPFFLQLQLLDDWVENTGALNDLKNGRRKLGIVDHQIGIALAEDARVLGGRFHFHKHRRLIFALLKKRENCSRNDDQEKREQNEHPMN